MRGTSDLGYTVPAVTVGLMVAGLGLLTLMPFVRGCNDPKVSEQETARDLATRSISMSRDIIGAAKLVSNEREGNGQHFRVWFKCTYRAADGSIRQGAVVANVSLESGAVTLTYE